MLQCQLLVIWRSDRRGRSFGDFHGPQLSPVLLDESTHGVQALIGTFLSHSPRSLASDFIANLSAEFVVQRLVLGFWLFLGRCGADGSCRWRFRSSRSRFVCSRLLGIVGWCFRCGRCFRGGINFACWGAVSLLRRRAVRLLGRRRCFRGSRWLSRFGGSGGIGGRGFGLLQRDQGQPAAATQ